MANILLLTHLNERRHIKPVIDRLFKEHKVLVYNTSQVKVPYWYKILWLLADYDFYYRRMPHQIDYYKQRIWMDCPRWLKLITPFLFPLGFLKRFYNPPQEVYEKLKSLNPDIVLATSLMFVPLFEDHQYAIACKELGIPLIGFVPTWDSATNKSFTYPEPDLMFCWNEAHKEQLIKFHKLDGNKIKMVGAYNFEEWLLLKQAQRRDKFMRKYGWEKKDKFLLYICSSPQVFWDETPLISKLAGDTGMKVLVQIHPDKPKSISFQETEQVKFSKTISFDNYTHCENVWMINSSALFEARLLNKRINIMRLGDVDVLKTQESIHFQSLQPVWEGKMTDKEWLGLDKKLPSEQVNEILKAYGNTNT